MEVEQKFEDGMLSKFSKITDLMARLDAFDSNEHVSPEEKKRAKKFLIFLPVLELVIPHAVYTDLICKVICFHYPCGCSGWFRPWNRSLKLPRRALTPLSKAGVRSRALSGRMRD